MAIRSALARRPTDEDLQFFLADILSELPGREHEAEKLYRELLHAPLVVSNVNNLTRVTAGLVAAVGKQPGRSIEAVEIQRQLIVNLLNDAGQVSEALPSVCSFARQFLIFAKGEDNALVESYFRKLLKEPFVSGSVKNQLEVIEVLADAIKAQSGRLSEKIAVEIERAALARNDSTVLNSVAWRLYELGSELSRAEEYAKRAVEIGDHSMAVLQTLIAILIRQGKWDESKTHLRDWIECVRTHELRSEWHYFILMFRDIIKWHKDREMADLIEERVSELEWLAIRLALQKDVLSFNCNCDGDTKQLAFRLGKQLYGDDEEVRWPGSNCEE